MSIRRAIQTVVAPHDMPVPEAATISRANTGGYLSYHWYDAGLLYMKYVHRHVWEQQFGPIPPGYVVHHVDGNIYNNDIDNLRCMSARDHQHVHVAGRSRQHETEQRDRRQKMQYLAEIDRMLRHGRTLDDVAQELGVTRQCVSSRLNRWGVRVAYVGMLVPATTDDPGGFDVVDRLCDIDPDAAQGLLRITREMRSMLLLMLAQNALRDWNQIAEHEVHAAELNIEMRSLRGLIRPRNTSRLYADGRRRTCDNGCDAPVLARGLCSRCYQRSRTTAA